MHACVHKHTHTHASTCRPLLTEPHGPNHPLTHPHPPPDLEQAKVTITHLFTGWRWSSLYLKQIPCPPQGFLRSVAQGFWSQGHNRIHTVQEGSHSRTTNHCSLALARSRQTPCTSGLKSSPVASDWPPGPPLSELHPTGDKGGIEQLTAGESRKGK